MDVYVFLSSGIYKYDYKAHKLIHFKSGDLRDKAAVENQKFAKEAPVNIVIVSNFDKIGGKDASDEYKAVTAGFHAGAISQNIYLYCASVGLNTVVRKMLDYDLLSKTLELKPTQKITAAQTVGFAN
jgi:SagB-type dehydrogenase family enzyme